MRKIFFNSKEPIEKKDDVFSDAPFSWDRNQGLGNGMETGSVLDPWFFSHGLFARTHERTKCERDLWCTKWMLGERRKCLRPRKWIVGNSMEARMISARSTFYRHPGPRAVLVNRLPLNRMSRILLYNRRENGTFKSLRCHYPRFFPLLLCTVARPFSPLCTSIIGRKWG